jgi:hypothetical protein
MTKQLDDMIADILRPVTPSRFGNRVTVVYPETAVVQDYLDECVPHPINDYSNHFLMRRFCDVRTSMAAWPIPAENGFRGQVTYPWFVHEKNADGSWLIVDGHLASRGKTAYSDTAEREMPWRCFHGDADWPCSECGHAERCHDRSHAWDNCDATTNEGHPCNCGNNVGR